MPHRILTLAEAAAYLHLPTADFEHLVKTTDVPSQRRGSRLVFLRGSLDVWASQRLLRLPPKHLEPYHQKTTRATREVFEHDALIPALLQPANIAPALASKTRKSVLRDLVALAYDSGRVGDAAELLASIEAREELCPTALPGGLALLHCRHHEEFRFDDSFLVLGRTIQPIHFGAPDGRPTRLFFLICCQDERIHLHALARLCMMGYKTDVIAQLFDAPDAAAMFDALLAAEQTVLTGKKPSGGSPPG
jgi:mannitol/fructose-specific phosphotransferase system IIA component (Ntr-type)